MSSYYNYYVSSYTNDKSKLVLFVRNSRWNCRIVNNESRIRGISVILFTTRPITPSIYFKRSSLAWFIFDLFRRSGVRTWSAEDLGSSTPRNHFYSVSCGVSSSSDAISLDLQQQQQRRRQRHSFLRDDAARPQRRRPHAAHREGLRDPHLPGQERPGRPAAALRLHSRACR